MTHRDIVSNRRTVLKTVGVLGTIGGVSGVGSANSNGDQNPRLDLVGHTTLGARDGANTHGAVSEEHDLAAVGSFVFGDNELRLVDISDRTDPELVSTIFTDPDGHSSDIRNSDVHPTEPWVFTANEGGEDTGWAIVDASDRENPELIGPFTVEDASSGVHNVQAFGDDYLITVGHGRGAVVYDISDREDPIEVSSFQMPKPDEDHDDGHEHEADGETIHAAHVRGDYAFLAHWNRGLYVLDMSDPERLEVVVSFDYSEEEADVPLRACHHAVPHPSNDICLLGEEIGTGEPGYKHIVSFDLENGETELQSSFQFPQHANQPTGNQGYWWTGHFSDWGVSDQQDVVFSGDYKAGVQAFDVSDPGDPVRIDQYLPAEGVDEVRREDPVRHDLVDNVPFTWGAESSLAGDSGHVYASDATTGFYIFTLEGY
ncbi:LVIVD repeat-containing protein [Halalkalicoccus ordinarius]|uniref:LVIVD repeat-containing protein n=1 Tax=Halalkalicoccus ordinarius TaxID=3116651 RepID=UPI00300F5831